MSEWAKPPKGFTAHSEPLAHPKFAEPEHRIGHRKKQAPHMKQSMSVFNEPAPTRPWKNESQRTKSSVPLDHNVDASANLQRQTRHRPHSASPQPSKNYMRGTQAIPSYMEKRMELRATTQDYVSHDRELYATAHSRRAANRTLETGTTALPPSAGGGRVGQITDPFGRPLSSDDKTVERPKPQWHHETAPPNVGYKPPSNGVGSRTSGELVHHGDAYATATQRVENKTLKPGTCLFNTQLVPHRTNAQDIEKHNAVRTTQAEFKDHGAAAYATATVRAQNKTLAKGTCLFDVQLQEPAPKPKKNYWAPEGRKTAGEVTHDEYKHHDQYGVERAANKSLALGTQAYSYEKPMQFEKTSAEYRNHQSYGVQRAPNLTLARNNGMGLPGELVWGGKGAAGPSSAPKPASERPTTAPVRRSNPSLTSTLVLG